jgi:hypothetical protein
VCAAYGSGAALTLDEFALWLNLEDDYWTKQGPESIDAVVLFGSLLSLSVLGKGFFTELLATGGAVDQHTHVDESVAEGNRSAASTQV